MGATLGIPLDDFQLDNFFFVISHFSLHFAYIGENIELGFHIFVPNIESKSNGENSINQQTNKKRETRTLGNVFSFKTQRIQAKLQVMKPFQTTLDTLFLFILSNCVCM